MTHQYQSEVATIKPDNYHLRISDRGQKLWSGDQLIAELPRDDWTIIALDNNGNSRELQPGEREEIVRDATTKGAFSKEWKSVP